MIWQSRFFGKACEGLLEKMSTRIANCRRRSHKCFLKMNERISIRMNIEIFREYCLKQVGVTEELPFGPDTLVYKVMGKAFALTGLNEAPGSCNLKCDPAYAEELRERFPSVI